MAASNPSATTASQSPTPDIQQLVGLLGNLMPLLLRLQSQVFPQQAFPQQAYPEGASQAFPWQAFPSQAFEPSFQGGISRFRTQHSIVRRRKISSVTSSPNSCARSRPIWKPMPGNMPAFRVPFRSSRRPRTGSRRETTLRPST